MSVAPVDEVWEVRGLPAIGEPTGADEDSPPPQPQPQLPAENGAGDGDRDGDGDGGVAGRVAICRRERFVRLEGERRRETRLVEARIEQTTCDLAQRMGKMLWYGEDDIVRWKSRVEPHHFHTYCAADFVTLMDDLNEIYRVRRDIIVEGISQQMSLEAERTVRLRSVFKKYHPLLTRAFHKMPAQVEEQLELEAVAMNEMMLGNLRHYTEIRFNRLTCELRAKQKLTNLWRTRRDAWRTLNIRQARNRLSVWLESSAVEALVEAPLAELETEMATVWQHYRDHVTGLPDLFLRMVTDESLDLWQDEAYDVLNAMGTMFTTHWRSYEKLYVRLENAWYHQLELVGDDLISREVTDAEAWEALADEHTEVMFGPIKKKVQDSIQEAQTRWDLVIKAAPGQVDHLYSYIASSCEVFSIHLAERDRYAKKLDVQLTAVDNQQTNKENLLAAKISKAVVAMMGESKVNRVNQIQQGLEKTMMLFLPTYEQCQERRLTLLLQYSQRLEEETLLAQQNVADKLEVTVTAAEPPPEQPPADCHRLLSASREVLLSLEELAELQKLSAANIRWFLSWERRKMEDVLGDFLVEKLQILRDVFNQKVEGLSERVREIESAVHDRRSSEIQLHQQRVDSHCRSVAEQLTNLASQLSSELDWMKSRVDEDRAWMQQHELKSRGVERAYVLEIMLKQMSDREDTFIECIVTRAGEFRAQVVSFLADLVASTEAFIRQLVPQADPASLLEPPPGAPPLNISTRGADSVRMTVLKENAAKTAAKNGEVVAGAGKMGSSTGKRSRSAMGSAHRKSMRKGSGKKKEEEEDDRVGNFSKDEIDKYKLTLKKLLFTIEATGKIHVKSLEHKMELFCGQLDDSIKKAYVSIMTQIGDVNLSESMQHSYVSIKTLIKFEIHLNQEETFKTQKLIEDLESTLDSYERKWKMSLKQESQLNVFFQPRNSIGWDQHSVLLSDCLVEGTSTLDMVTKIFTHVTSRHMYLYFGQLDGTVSFTIPSSTPLTESEVTGAGEAGTSASSDTIGLTSGGSASQTRRAPSAAKRSTKSGKSVKLAGTATTKSGQSADTARRKGSAKGGESTQSGRSSPTAPGDASTVSNGITAQPGSSNYAADVSNTQETDGDAVSADAASAATSAAASRATSRAATGKQRAKKASVKKRKREVKPMLSKMEDPQVRTLIFGSADQLDESDNFIQKIKRKIMEVLEETRDYAADFYATKGSRPVTRPDLIPATYEEFLEIVFSRFRGYYLESTQYQLSCFAEFCAEFAQFACCAARIPGLLFGHQDVLYCRKVAALTRDGVHDITGLHQTWQRTAGELERRLRPSLGHPNMHDRLLKLVEHCVSEKEAYLSQLKSLDDAYAKERSAMEGVFQLSTEYIMQRCEDVLHPLSSAAHLNSEGQTTLKTHLEEAVHQARSGCLSDWEAETGAAQDGWSTAVGETRQKCLKWETAWFGGVETIQQLFLVCDT